MNMAFVAAAAGALAGSVALGGVASAAAHPTARHVPVAGTVVLAKSQALPGHTHLKSFHALGGRIQPMHVSSIDSFWNTSEAWGANVRVDSGASGAVTYCSTGATVYGPLVGPGYWQFGGNCYGNGYLTGWGTYGY
jgi:hypothetical protein